MIKFRAFTALFTVSLMTNTVVSSAYICISPILAAAMLEGHLHQAMETPAGAVCDVICDLVSIDVATEQL